MEEFFTNPANLLSLVSTLITFVIVLIITKDVKKAGKEAVKMIYKMSNYRDGEAIPSDKDEYAQNFTPYEDDYELDEATNELHKLEKPKNCQEIINSGLESALDNILRRLMPDKFGQPDQNMVIDGSRSRDKLEEMSRIYDTAEEFRSRYHLSDELDVQQVFGEVQRIAEESKAKNQTYRNFMEVKNNVEKKETEPKSEQSPVHEDGEKSPQVKLD